MFETLEQEHQDCLEDVALRERAEVALPAALAVYNRARGIADYHAVETGAAGGSERHWEKSGGRDAYSRELVAEQRWLTLRALVEQKTNMGRVGYFVRAEIEGAIASVEN
jgi:hypothetical protein